MGTPSGQYVHRTHNMSRFLMSSSSHPYPFLCSFWGGFVVLFDLYSLFMHLFICLFFFFYPLLHFLSPHLLRVCTFVLWNWKIPVGQIIVASFFPPILPSLSLWKASTQLEPRRLKRGAWERRNKGPSVCSHHHSVPPLLSPPCSSLPWSPRLSSLYPLASAPN